MNNRLKAIRLTLNLSQEEFGSNIGIKSRAHISSLENGTRNITDRIIIDVCREYNISEKWLRTGEGEMFSSTPVTCISELTKEYDLDLMDQNLISEYLKLDKLSRSVLKRYIKNVFLATIEDHHIEIPEKTEDNHNYLTQTDIDALYAEMPETADEFEKMYPPIDINKDAG